MRKRDELVLAAVAGRRANREGWVRGNCPWCEIKTGKPDRKQCLGLNIHEARWHCFRCGSAGLILELPDDITAMRPAERDPSLEPEPRTMEPPEGFVSLYESVDWFTSLAGAEPLAYLRQRGISEELGRVAKIGAVFDGKLRGRIVVPILDLDDEGWLGWSARAWFANAFRKYLYPSGMRRAEILYNHKALHLETERPVFLVEGVFDALALWPDGVAVLGKPSKEQLEAFLVARRPVVAAFDGDAWEMSRALIARLRFEGVRSGFIRLPPEVDPDEVPRARIDELAAESLEA